jgi:cytochrome bd-type quinol oxidase subunit 2
MILVPLLIVVSLWVISQAGEFVGLETADSQNGIATINRLTKSTQTGGSAFNSGQSLLVRVAESPFLMFRPFPWEATGGMAAVAAVEALGLLWFAWKRRRGLRAALHQWREPFITFILTYSLLFSVAFAAATSNFGILVRERIMMVPILLMLFCAKLEQATARSSTSRREFLFSGANRVATSGHALR